MPDSDSLGHLPLCEELLGLAESQRKALTEGRPDEAEELLGLRQALLERIKLLDGVPPVESERARLSLVLGRLQELDEEIQMILRMQMNTTAGRMESVARSREFANSASAGPADKKSKLNISA